MTGNRQPAKSAAGQGPDETSLDVSFTMDEQEQSQMDEETFKNLHLSNENLQKPSPKPRQPSKTFT